MKRLLAVFCVAALVQPALAQNAVQKAENRLADLLAPGNVPAAGFTQPKAWNHAKAIDRDDMALRPYAGTPVRLPQPPLKDVKPRSAPEGTPLASHRDQTAAPAALQLPTEPLVKLPPVDVQTPLPVPILGQPNKDRAPLGDPALEASLEAALKAFTPARTGPVPFIPLNLPDPFEHVRHGQLRNPPEENPTPPALPLQKPTAK